MAAYHIELLVEAARLTTAARAPKLSKARIRRSISTSYYALFHFLLDDACRRLAGSNRRLSDRRHILARTFTHAGVKFALNKIRGRAIDPSLEDFLRPVGAVLGVTRAPDFARFMAAVFVDAQTQRHNADYDLNVTFSETDARELQKKCREAIDGWQQAASVEERDFKDAFAILMLLRGQIRKDG